jgi:hypothetical protein
MSRKHFNRMAEVLGGDLATCTTDGERNKVRGIILSVADVFAQENSDFSRAIFYAACGLTAEGELYTPAHSIALYIETNEGGKITEIVSGESALAVRQAALALTRDYERMGCYVTS